MKSIETIRIIHQRFGEYGFQLLQENRLSVISSTSDSVGFDGFTSSDNISAIQYPLPILQPGNGNYDNVEIENIKGGQKSQIVISGYTTASVDFGSSNISTMVLSNSEEGVFIAKYESDGSFVTALSIVGTLLGIQSLSISSTIVSEDGSLLSIVNNKNSYNLNSEYFDTGASLFILSPCTSCNDDRYCDIQSTIEDSECICNPGMVSLGM